MELRSAVEAATADLDVRPGFVGDVMAGGRRRHTRSQLALTAAVALLAGVTTGVVLTDSSPEPAVAADARLTATTAGDLSGGRAFISEVQALRGRPKNAGLRPYENVTEFTGPLNVFWAATTPSGPAAPLCNASSTAARRAGSTGSGRTARRTSPPAWAAGCSGR
ncbi:hypothetical protein [Lentzea sp. CC55]|uniref:hypothetical protein n=1 Tax=Lentzea sp. CC55 TaxID=2884909 RepID=UPI001F3F2057|nr:hypothetical protein [Lentzea sp. CC55]MCG8921386.1 hypothetical protein [Lentzea sp. CC55]